jgi:glycosyltransferase involved in cell wall biosynthesis
MYPIGDSACKFWEAAGRAPARAAARRRETPLTRRSVLAQFVHFAGDKTVSATASEQATRMSARAFHRARSLEAQTHADRVKLIIQIPCFNEADTLREALEALPRRIDGIDEVETLVIDDGSTDDTVDVALACGVDHVVSHVGNRGLAAAFVTGLRASLARGADIIVNTDADNQYEAQDIPKLIAPILSGRAEFVIGARPIAETEHFSAPKKFLQRLGSAVVRFASDTNVADAPSGFRAMSRDAAMQLNVFSKYTYTLETIIQAGAKGIRVVNVPIRTNRDLRPSRLVKSIGDYVRRSMLTIAHVFLIYKPFRLLGLVGSVFLAIGLLLGARYLYFVAIGEGGGHVQSVILMAIFLLMGFHTFSLAIIANLISVNRRLLEELQVGLRKMQLGIKRR